MAEKGVMVVMLSRPAAPQPKHDASLEATALAWLEANIPKMDLKASADFDKLVLAGHSAGNHVTCEFLKADCGKAKAVKVMVACAPDRISNQRFFNAWSGPIWMVNATKYGHLDVNDDSVEKMGGIICATDSEPNDVYRAHIAEQVDAFLSVVFDGDAAAEKKLSDISSMGVDAEAQKDYNGHSAPFTA